MQVRKFWGVIAGVGRMDKKYEEIREHLIWAEVKLLARSRALAAKGDDDEALWAESERVGAYAVRCRQLRGEIEYWMGGDTFVEQLNLF